MPVLYYLFIVAVTFGISSAVTWLVVKYGEKLQIMDDPKRHKHAKVVHTQAVPRGGGIPIIVTLIIGVVFLIAWSKQLWGVLLGGIVLAVVGFLDDRFEEKISPYLRLGINVLAALAVIIAGGVGIAYITNPLGGVIALDQPQMCLWILGEQRCLWLLSDLFALVWLVWMQNVVGWSSGVDGQLPGFVVIAAITMGILGMRFDTSSHQAAVLGLSAITAGAYGGFLVWNWFPQKIIPGYGGKSLAGFLLGVLAIMTVGKVGALTMILGVPFVDAILVMIKRIREGRSPVWGGREHLHHYLLAAGWSKQRIAFFYTAVSALMAVAALQLNSRSQYFTMAAVSLVVGGVILWFHYFSTYLKRHDQDNG